MKKNAIPARSLFALVPLMLLGGCNKDTGTSRLTDDSFEKEKSSPITVVSYAMRGNTSMTSKTVPNPDNTAMNHQDNTSDTKTVMDQSETTSAIQISATIRRAVTADDALSVNAKNCKIITDEFGRVTLRGVVADQAERDTVERMARMTTGVIHVENQLQILKPVVQ